MNNQLLIKISLDDNFEPRKDANSFAFNKVSITINRNSLFEFDQLNYRYNEQEGILTGVLGYFSNWDKLKFNYGAELNSDVELLEKIYLQEGIKNLSELTRELDGIYLLVIYHMRQNKLYLFQSIFGYGLPIYYVSDKQHFTISTSLKTLLKHVGIKRELDTETAAAFISAGLVYNERTLIKGVRKLVTHTYLEYNLALNKFSTNWCSNKLIKMEESIAKKNLVAGISENIQSIANKLNDKVFHSTITRGWDTNTILSQLKMVNHQKIKLYSVDGGNEFSEIEEVKEILTNSQNTELAVHEIDIKTLNRLPDIVWRYEGFVFEMGIFLRYDLASFLLKGNTKHIFVGSGADPVLDSTMGPGGNNAYQQIGNPFYKSFLYGLKKRIKGGVIGDFWFKYFKTESAEDHLRRKKFNPNFKVRFNTEIEYNLKMHEILFNSFQLSGLYPFLNKNTVAAANSIRKLNVKKAFYKEQMKVIFGDRVTSAIKKTGKVLDTDRLYFENREPLIKLLDKPIFEKIIGASGINKIKQNPENYKSIITQLAYLFIFDKLFISAEYDNSFDSEKLDITLDELI
jgi:asparagine synthase (glutamine-hydrolysing)